MSKENAIGFFQKASEDQQLKEQVKSASHQDEVLELGKAQGFDFSSEHAQEALAEIQQQQPDFVRDVVEAVLRIFRASDDNYPATGMQPFSDDP
jgi:predicted ribosomally synthesized peptide with nif11-like leader